MTPTGRKALLLGLGYGLLAMGSNSTMDKTFVGENYNSPNLRVGKNTINT